MVVPFARQSGSEKENLRFPEEAQVNVRRKISC